MYLACNVAYANFKNVLSRNDISLDRRLKIYTMPKLCPPCSIIITAVMLLTMYLTIQYFSLSLVFSSFQFPEFFFIRIFSFNSLALSVSLSEPLFFVVNFCLLTFNLFSILITHNFGEFSNYLDIYIVQRHIINLILKFP